MRVRGLLPAYAGNAGADAYQIFLPLLKGRRRRGCRGRPPCLPGIRVGGYTASAVYFALQGQKDGRGFNHRGHRAHRVNTGNFYPQINADFHRLNTGEDLARLREGEYGYGDFCPLARGMLVRTRISNFPPLIKGEAQEVL
jgi:hypothetical protein